jgi:hypothetical protein
MSGMSFERRWLPTTSNTVSEMPPCLAAEPEYPFAFKCGYLAEPLVLVKLLFLLAVMIATLLHALPCDRCLLRALTCCMLAGNPL